MKTLIKNANVFGYGKADVLVSGSVISEISSSVNAEADFVIDADGMHIFPAFADVHVHLREPGFIYKETVETGTKAAARGGFAHVCSMPNLNPVPDSSENLAPQLEAIKRDAVINVYPYGAITVGQKGEELSDMEALAPDVIAFSDDGRGVQNEELMREAMLKAKALGKKIVAHCEDNALLHGGYIHDGEYAKANGHKGICSESEWGPIKRDIELVKETGVSYHVCHVSAKESVELISKAKAEGVDITCETAPHYLLYSDRDLKDRGNFKMNPPIRGDEDRKALIAGIIDGTVDMIATDHAPHSAEEKSGGLEKSLNGVVGIETSFPVMYTYFVKTGIITIEKLVELMSTNPGKRFGFETELKAGNPANLTVFNLEVSKKVDPSEFLSMGKSSPFEGVTVEAECVLTMAEGEIVWKK